MSNKKQQIPAIRFNGFTDAWEQRKLSEMTEYKNGKGYEDKQRTHGKYELINLNSISIDGGLKHSGKYIDDANETLKKYDLVMVLSDIGHGDLLGRVALIPEDNRFVLNQRVALLRPKSFFNPLFLFSYINQHQKYFKNQGAGMSQLNISRGSVESFSSYVPSAEEQTKIGTFFKQLDDTIALHQRQLNKYNDLKLTMLQKMFPNNDERAPQVRFDGFTGDWERRKFGDLWRKSSERNNDLKYSSQNVLSVAQMKLNPVERNSTDDYMKTYNVLYYGDIAFEGNKSKNYSFGRFVLNDVQDGIVSHVFISFRPKVEMNIDFMKIYINNENVMKHHLVKATTKTLMMTTLNVHDMNKQFLVIPNIDEQAKIGMFFKKLDDNIALHQKKIHNYNCLKKAFLQGMFV